MFKSVRVVDPRSTTVAAWNVQRGTQVDAIADKLLDSNASIALLTECDIGMARSGNIDTVAEIAIQLGMGHAFVVEFEECGLGNAAELDRCVGLTNREALHGNAVLSRRPFQRVSRIALDDGGRWEAADQPRVGGRVAVAAEIDGIWFVATHFESRTGATERAIQMDRLLTRLNELGMYRCVLGGDFNTTAVWEPLVSTAQAEGFAPVDFNGHDGRFKSQMKDWFFHRGVAVTAHQIHDATGISDHDLITVDIAV